MGDESGLLTLLAGVREFALQGLGVVWELEIPQVVKSLESDYKVVH
jgi:hypothetical protein